MPRRPRMYLPGWPYHLTQRGNNRQACFVEPDNYRYYLELMQEVAGRYGVAIHAYCLMTNHIHFLVTPQSPTAISNTMKVVGSRYARYFNLRYRRTGTLWEGRHYASLIQSEKYLLTCHRYIELNPVRAGMVVRPEEYRWSSYGANAWGDNSLLKPHQEYLRLGLDGESRCQAYRQLFQQQLGDADLHRIRKAAHYNQPIGDDRFRRQIEGQYGINLGQSKRGRPKKNKEGAG